MITIRLADTDDAALIGRVHVESWQSTYEGILPEDYLTDLSEVRVAASWGEILAKSGRVGATFVLEDEAEGIVGFADSGPERGGKPKAGEITSIYLLKAWQRQGYGRRLVAQAARYLAAHEAESLAIWALEANMARGFYETLGGIEAERRQIRFAGTVLAEVCYRWLEIGDLLLVDILADYARLREA